jgi:Domain of unknown function (DUF1841)
LGVNERRARTAWRPGPDGDNCQMFAPSQNDVRTFFCQAWAQHQAGAPLEPMATLAVEWMSRHPEYHADLADLEAALAAVYTVDEGRTNPFLHLSMHLSISEQCSIDQPRGIRQAVELLAAKRGDLHAAQHEVMDCLGEMLWASQRSGQPPDPHAYLDAVRRRATR